MAVHLHGIALAVASNNAERELRGLHERAMLVPAVRILALTAPWRAYARWALGIIMTLPFGALTEKLEMI